MRNSILKEIQTNQVSAIQQNFVGKIAEEVVTSRRGLLQGIGAAFVIGIGSQGHAFERYASGAESKNNGTVHDPLVFISIDKDGSTTIYASRPDMGTGIRTSLPMVIADELEADWSQVTIIQADGDEIKFGNQDTDGSRSMRHLLQPMRQAGGAMRLMLEQAAANQWKINVDQVRAQMHAVYKLDASGAIDETQSLSYGELAEYASELPVPEFEAIKFKTADEFRYLGKGEVKIADLKDITMGRANYGSDHRPEGSKFAVVAHPPVVGATIKSMDDSETLKVPGVIQTIQLESAQMPTGFTPLGGVIVVAENTHAAIQGKYALKIEWDMGANESFNSEEYKATMAETVKKPGTVVRAMGDADTAFESAVSTFEAEYYTPEIAHAPMEPPVAVADVKADSAEFWAPVQSPYEARVGVAEAIGLDVEKVTLHTTLLGGGFGRKAKHDFVTEAAIASQTIGAPVVLQWMREDDVQNGYFHASAYERLEAAMDENNKVIGLRHRSVSPSIISLFAPDIVLQSKLEQGMGLIDNPFEIANMSIEIGEAPAHVRFGWFRAVANLHHAFAAQCFVADLADSLGKDPKDMLLELIGSPRVIDSKASGFGEDFYNYDAPYDEFPVDTARLIGVINRAADEAGWGQDLPEGEGLGIAAHRSFVTYVATVVRVKVLDDGSITIPEVHTAVDCGFVVNPERIRSQVEGAAIMGTSMAMYSKIDFKDGAAVQSNFHDFKMARMNVSPINVSTHIIEHPFSVHAGGIGEPPLPPFAPALANAIAAASGKRLREMPFGEKV